MKRRTTCRLFVTFAITLVVVLVVSGTALAVGSHVNAGTHFTFTRADLTTTGVFTINARQVDPNGGGTGRLTMKAETVREDVGLFATVFITGKILYCVVDGDDAWLGGEFVRAEETYYYDEWGAPLDDPIKNDFAGWQFWVRVQDAGVGSGPDRATAIWFDDDPGFALTALTMPDDPAVYPLYDYVGWSVRIR